MGETTKREREKAVIAIKPCLSPNRQLSLSLFFSVSRIADCRLGFGSLKKFGVERIAGGRGPMRQTGGERC